MNVDSNLTLLSVSGGCPSDKNLCVPIPAVVVPKPTIINGLDGNQFQIVMNGEPLQIIPVDSHETQIDGEGRHIITNDGQQLEVTFWQN